MVGLEPEVIHYDWSKRIAHDMVRLEVCKNPDEKQINSSLTTLVGDQTRKRKIGEDSINDHSDNIEYSSHQSVFFPESEQTNTQFFNTTPTENKRANVVRRKVAMGVFHSPRSACDVFNLEKEIFRPINLRSLEYKSITSAESPKMILGSVTNNTWKNQEIEKRENIFSLRSSETILSLVSSQIMNTYDSFDELTLENTLRDGINNFPGNSSKDDVMVDEKMIVDQTMLHKQSLNEAEIFRMLNESIGAIMESDEIKRDIEEESIASDGKSNNLNPLPRIKKYMSTKDSSSNINQLSNMMDEIKPHHRLDNTHDLEDKRIRLGQFKNQQQQWLRELKANFEKAKQEHYMINKDTLFNYSEE